MHDLLGSGQRPSLLLCCIKYEPAHYSTLLRRRVWRRASTWDEMAVQICRLSKEAFL